MGTTKIYVYGASGHGLVVADVALAARGAKFSEVVFLDDAAGLKFSKDLPKHPVIIAIGDNKTRAKIQERVSRAGFEIATLIHQSAIVSPSASIGEGAVVMPGAVINARAKIGRGAIINSGVVIEHECEIGEFAHISPNAALAGGVKVGAFSHIGIGASVIQRLSIGQRCIIGAGAAVVRDIASDSVAVGVPARVIKKNS